MMIMREHMKGITKIFIPLFRKFSRLRDYSDDDGLRIGWYNPKYLVNEFTILMQKCVSLKTTSPLAFAHVIRQLRINALIIR